MSITYTYEEAVEKAKEIFPQCSRLGRSEIQDILTFGSRDKKRPIERCSVLPEESIKTEHRDVGFFFDNFTLSYKLIKNPYTKVRFFGLLRSMFARGYDVYWMSPQKTKFKIDRPNAHNMSYLQDRMPEMKGHKARDYCRMVLDNADEITKDWPKLDDLIICIYPMFPKFNVWFWLLVTHYSKQGTNIVFMDIDFKFVHGLNSRTSNNPFSFDGTMLALTAAEMQNVCGAIRWGLPVKQSSLAELRGLNPRIKIIPLSHQLCMFTGFYKYPRKNPSMDVSYVGWDFNRKSEFQNVLAPIGKYLNTHVFGGSINSTCFSGDTAAIFQDCNLHDAIDRDRVVDIYNDSYCVVNVSRKKYYEAGWANSRWYEVVNGGAILLVTDSYRFIDEFFSEEFIVPSNTAAIVDRVKWVKSLSWAERARLNDKQRRQVLPFFSTYSAFRTIFLGEDCVDGRAPR